ncbi:MAG: AAA family ATPase [Planctomycetota bacterium]
MQADLLMMLREAARQLRLGRPLPPSGELTDRAWREVQSDFRALLDQPGVSIEKIASALGEGFSPATLRTFRDAEGRSERSKGDPDRVPRGLNQVHELLGQRSAAKLPRGFVETAVAERICTVIEQTARLGIISLISGPPGVGKSMAIDACRSLIPGLVVIRVRQTSRRPVALIRQIGVTLGVKGASSNAALAEERIIQALAGTGRTLAIDESHRLHATGLEALRDIHDEAGVPMALIGTDDLLATVEAEQLYGQLSSRIGLRYRIAPVEASGGPDGGRPLYTPEEVARMFASSKVRFTGEGIETLTKIANLPGLGGLRLARQVVHLAAGVAGSELIDGKLLRRALRSIQGDLARRVIETMDQVPTLAATTG